MRDSQPADHNPPKLDPVYLHARREAIEILAAWAVALCWTVGYCGVFGYERNIDEIELVFGVPEWVFWGIAVPWLAASAFTLYFSLFRMKQDPLGEEQSPNGAACCAGGKED